MLASPVSHFSPQKLSLFDQSYLPSKKIRATTHEQRRNFSLRASSNRNGNQVQISEKGHALKHQELLDHEYPYEFSSTESSANFRPRPSTPGQMLNLTSKGAGLRVAYQGVSGAYSQCAAEKAYPNCESVPCEQFENAFEAVEKGLVDRAVLPFENSLGGSIHRNYDLLYRHRLHVVGEVKLAIRHCLLANHGVKIEDLKRVFSHPQALAQCENTLTKLGLSREARDNTAGSAKFVASNNLRDAGAVANVTAARLYGLNILAQDIQDDSDNVTRFLMLARKPIHPGIGDKAFKTSIVFSLKDGPGTLFKPLSIFASKDINVTKIETRPLKKQALRAVDYNNSCPRQFPYLFYIDFEASVADQKAQNALDDLKEFATFLRVLGSYPVDTSIP